MRNTDVKSSHAHVALLCGTILCGLIAATPSFAQTAAPAIDADTGKGEIVVTALRRSQTLQSAPADITALSGVTLRLSGAQNYGDFLTAIPGVNYSANGGYKDKIFIRGLSDSLSSRVLSTTGIYLDEVPLTEVDGTLGDNGTFDISRVEVLKGPQGTLYGSSSMGGTVRIITNKPDLDHFGAAFDGTLNHVKDGGTGGEANAMVNVPLIRDALAVRLVGEYVHDAGWVTNSATGQGDINDLTRKLLRAQVRAKPIDNLTINLMFQYQKSDQNYGPFVDVGAVNSVRRLYPDYSNYTSKIYNATIDYHTSFANVISTTSYVDKTNNYGRDLTPLYGAALPGLTHIPFPATSGFALIYQFPNKLFTQEVRIASNGSGPFSWLVGGFYSNFKPHNLQTGATNAPGYGGLDLYTSDTQYKREEIAGFGEVSYMLFHKLELTAGVRVFKYNITSSAFSAGYIATGSPAASAVTTLHTSDSSHVAKFRAAYHVSSNNMLYAQASQGYRAGGPDGAFTATCAAQVMAQTGTVPTSYTPDKLWDYEIGSKNTFLDKRLTLNATAYYINWKNAQVAQNLPCGAQFISNAGGAHSRGAEIEAAFTPVDHLDLTANAAYTKSTFIDTNTQLRTIAGGDLPNVPRWTYAASAQYTVPLSDRSEVYLRGDVRHIGSRLNDLVGLATGLYRMPAYTLLNARLGYRFGPYELALYGTNIANKKAILNATFQGYNYYTVFAPRTVGVNFKFHM